MEGIFLEFENENAIRSYPFAAGCAPIDSTSDQYIPDGVFIDAAIYPINPQGNIYLSSISEKGVFEISDDTGVIMSGSPSGNLVELFDNSGLGRHTGTLVASSADALNDFALRGNYRSYDKSQTTFASSCTFPIVVDGVTSINVEGTGAVDGNLSFSNGPSDSIRVSSGTLQDGRSTIRFDILPRLTTSDEKSIKKIICVVDGKTPFRISRAQGLYNTVIIQLDGIDREDVCSAAHRENSFEMTDTCNCEEKPDLPSSTPLPDTYQIVEVVIPPMEGVSYRADNAFYLAAPNMPGYKNPISLTLEDGVIAPKTNDLDVVIDGYSADLKEGELLDRVNSKGVVIQVPGLSGGAI